MIQISAFYVGLLALMLIMLSYNVASRRRRLGVGVGDGEDRGLLKAIRVHSNFVEYVPTALILLVILELNHANTMLLHICGGLLLVARILHFVGLTKSLGATPQRLIGVILTWMVIVILAALNIYMFIASSFLTA